MPASNSTVPHGFLKPRQVDDVAHALLSLAQEVWVLHDRQRILESVLADRGLDVGPEIDRYQPDEATRGLLDEQRKAFLERLVQSLAPEASR